ncbi:tetratricopeptide repeat protein [Marinobacter zhanjiangensis]|uniref:TPR repeat-containing protein n=1 Tax=Marinobacter zhanjiangensis TaxID=578215 RepID=A0ABQ3AZ95_9GAMM|nr:tetratricopeptide repeat protein [Marinobacter zhanjiangensis]GGY68846.1 TPR repeat-containing protein [Marinobacter zhanjiangensis]
MPRKALYLAISLLAFTGCASIDREEPAPAEPTETTTTQEPATEQPEAEVEERSFRPEELYLLVTGEIAAQRGQYDITLANYVEAARQSRDVGVIRRALLIAESLNSQSAARTLTNTWIDVAPYSEDARRAAAIQSLRDGDMEGTLTELEQILNLGGDADFDSLAAMAPRMPADQQQELLRLFSELQQRHPDNAEIRYSTALLESLMGAPQDALNTLAPLLDEKPEFQPALVLKGELLHDVGRTGEALEHLQTRSRRYPDNRQLGTLYARLLVNEDELRAAQDEFARLVERFPEEHGLRLSWALVAMENGELGLAREQLQRLTRLPRYQSQAYYYLGQAAEKDDNIDKAIILYEQVTEGSLYYPALTRAAELRARDGDLDSALEQIRAARESNPDDAANLWLAEVNLLQTLDLHKQAAEAASKALQAHPENQSLLYARSMSHENLGNIDQSLADLSTMVELQPDNPTALNALGYVLTIHTDRLSEARTYIEKALTMDPDNPAVLDSMGWVLFRQGDTEGALDYLRQAYEIYPDPEIAAHFGEVLWRTDQQAQARVVWERALDEAPDHELLLETLDRLGIEDL